MLIIVTLTLTLQLVKSNITGGAPACSNTPCSRAEDVVGEVDAGSVTDTQLLPIVPQPSELRNTAPSTHFLLNQHINREVTLNLAPPGSLDRQILVSAGSRGPQSTEWTMYHITELNDETLQPSTNPPLMEPQGGTHLLKHRERNLKPSTPSHPSPPN